MTVRKFLDLSTGHLTEKTRDRLDAGLVPSPTYPHPDGFGWLLYVPEEPQAWTDAEASPDLLACFNAAKERDCDYILFDCDAEAVDYLPYYEDEEGEEPTEPKAPDRNREPADMFESTQAPDLFDNH